MLREPCSLTAQDSSLQYHPSTHVALQDGAQTLSGLADSGSTCLVFTGTASVSSPAVCPCPLLQLPFPTVLATLEVQELDRGGRMLSS